jgi:hypothetical protein
VDELGISTVLVGGVSYDANLRFLAGSVKLNAVMVSRDRANWKVVIGQPFPERLHLGSDVISIWAGNIYHFCKGRIYAMDIVRHILYNHEC